MARLWDLCKHLPIPVIVIGLANYGECNPYFKGNAAGPS